MVVRSACCTLPVVATLLLRAAMSAGVTGLPTIGGAGDPGPAIQKAVNDWDVAADSSPADDICEINEAVLVLN